MAVTPREFGRFSAATVSTLLDARASDRLAGAADALPLKAVAFDALPIFRPAPVVARANDLFPGRDTALSDEWRLRRFQYAWLRTLSQRYVDFWQATQDTS